MINGIINNKSVQNKGCGIIYTELAKDIKNTLSPEDYEKYEQIIKPIVNANLYKKEAQLMTMNQKSGFARHERIANTLTIKCIKSPLFPKRVDVI